MAINISITCSKNTYSKNCIEVNIPNYFKRNPAIFSFGTCFIFNVAWSAGTICTSAQFYPQFFMNEIFCGKLVRRLDTGIKTLKINSQSCWLYSLFCFALSYLTVVFLVSDNICSCSTSGCESVFKERLSLWR